jgi:parvulin-like peptidyl-prolyl isomerase
MDSRTPQIRSRTSSTFAARLAVAAGVILLISWPAGAQQKPDPARPWANPTPTPPQTPGTMAPGVPGGGAPPQTSTPPPPPSDSPIIAKVEGRPITQRDYDRIAIPYFARLQQQLGDGLKDEHLRKYAEYNVFNELVRRELMTLEARKLNLEVTEKDTDAILATDPFFYTNGKFDPVKLETFKRSPQSNYIAILPRVREAASADKYERRLLAQLTPNAKAVREEWSKRKEQVRFTFLPMTTRDVTLEPEATAEEQLAFYRSHPERFERAPRANVRYLRLALPAEGDSLRASEERRLMSRGRSLADTLRRGVPIDTVAAPLGGAVETGWFDLPATMIPGLGSSSDLIEDLEANQRDSTRRVLGPGVTPVGVVVGVVAAREPRRVPAIEEVRADVKRSADIEKQQAQLEADKRAWYDQHLSELESARAQVTRVHLHPSAVSVKSPSRGAIDSWYKKNASSLFQAAGDTDRAASPPPIDDSLRTVVRTRLEEEERDARIAATTSRMSQDLARGKDPAQVARAAKAQLDTLTLMRGMPPDSLFPLAVVDSILTDRMPRGAFTGPRRFGTRQVLWRVDAVDTSFTPSFDDARSQVERGYSEARRVKEDEEARAYFDAHRDKYPTPQKYVVEYVQVPVPTPDSVAVPDQDIRRFYDQHTADRYRQEEEVRARHILISTRSGLSEQAALARTDSIRTAIMGGANFEEMARTRSEDLGSGVQGGDLGFFARGRMVKEFSDTSFALKVGVLSQPVKTSFGYHLIRVDERKEAGVRAFDEVRLEIRNELARAKGDTLARQQADAIRRRIPKSGAAVAASAVGGVKTSNPIAPNEPLAGVGSVPELGKDLPTLAVGTWAAKPYRASSSWVLARVTERMPPGRAEFPEARRQAIEDMKNAKRLEIVDQRAAAVRKQLQAGATLDSVAAEYGGLKDSGLLARQSGFVPQLGVEQRVIDKAFAMKAGVTSDSLRIANGLTWIRVEERRTMDGATFEADRDQVSRELLAQNMEDWLERKKKTVRIEVFREDLKGGPPSKFKTVTTTIGG